MAVDRRPLAVDDVIHGFARGAFGRDHYDCVRIEATGPDWIVARSASDGLCFASGKEDLLFLMEVRDEEKCPQEGDCPVARKVRLTDFGGSWT